MTIKRKITWGSGLLAGAFLLQAGATAIMDRRTEHAVVQLENSTTAMQNHMQADMMHDAVRGSVYRALYLADIGDMGGARDTAGEVDEYGSQLSEALAANRKLELDPAIKSKLTEAATALDAYIRDAREVAQMAAQNPEAARGRLAKFDEAFHSAENLQANLSNQFEQGMHATMEASDAQLDLALYMLVVVSLLFIGVLAWASRHLRKAVVEPIDGLAIDLNAMTQGDFSRDIAVPQGSDEIAAIQAAARAFRETGLAKRDSDAAQQHVVSTLAVHLSSLAQGDLTCKIKAPFGASYEELRETFNASLDRLADVLSKVTGTAQGVATGAREIHTASNDLSQRNEHQAARLEETAAAMNQVTQSVRSSAHSATEVQKAAAQAHGEASEGSDVVRRAVEAMTKIEQGASTITQIVDVIDGIAFQTNLLALNAGVEAARAGDAGKGFAVVANEVRALAQRSAEAAKDIKQQVADSTVRVADGVSLVGDAGDVFAKIVERVAEISTMMGEIALSIEGQSNNLGQVNSAVSDMDRMTQQNAAMVEESTAAARSLADEAANLSRLVGQFRLEDGRSRQEAEVVRFAGKQSRPAVPAFAGNAALDMAPGEDPDWAEF